MSNIKAVIFDWGGVIAPNQHGGWIGCFAELIGKSVENVGELWDEPYKKLTTGTITENKFWDTIESKLGYSLPDTKHDIWQKGTAIKPWPIMVDFVKQLKIDGYTLAILSNTIPFMTRLTSETHGYDCFDVKVLSDIEGISKPDIQIYRLALSRLKLKPDECVYVDDIEDYLTPAKSLGIRTILATSTPNENIAKIKRALGERR